MTPRATVLVPAFNEEAVIARGLARFASSVQAGEFQVIVICNGCQDATAEVARQALPGAEVLETPVPGKTHALNLGHRVARAPVRVYMDADLEVEVDAVRALIRPVEAGEAQAAIGHMRVDLAHSSGLVRSFYRVWALNPYLAHGKFGGLFALSAHQAERLHPLPAVTADDEWVRRQVAPSDTRVVDDCVFEVHAPAHLRDLVKIRRRSLRGTRALGRQGLMPHGITGARSGGHVLSLVAARPRLWLAAMVYVALSVWVRVSLALEHPERAPRWERDDSSRHAA